MIATRMADFRLPEVMAKTAMAELPKELAVTGLGSSWREQSGDNENNSEHSLLRQAFVSARKGPLIEIPIGREPPRGGKPHTRARMKRYIEFSLLEDEDLLVVQVEEPAPALGASGSPRAGILALVLGYLIRARFGVLISSRMTNRGSR